MRPFVCYTHTPYVLYVHTHYSTVLYKVGRSRVDTIHPIPPISRGLSSERLQAADMRVADRKALGLVGWGGGICEEVCYESVRVWVGSVGLSRGGG